MEKTLITEKLGLYGWSSLEPVLLAALTSELPMLLIGKHGCAKSFILERLSEELKMNYRFYNASLINYDDLVGIPIPCDNNTKLKYISNDNSIWDAEVVFIDEINRTKVELQNKLFPIIYDKRVQGTNLNKLKYRWAAMNPAYISEEDEEESLEYLGTNQLDPALADRFPFVIEVPSWNELSEYDKESIFKDQFKGKQYLDIDLLSLIKETKYMIGELKRETNNELVKYIITLMSLLENKFGYISSRRATMLYETFISVYASSYILNKHLSLKEPNYKDIACIHILNTLPFTALMKVDKTTLINIALEALKISKLDKCSLKDLLLTTDPIEKIKYLLNNISKIDSRTINEIIPITLGEIEIHKRKTVALALYLKLRNYKDMDASTMGTIINEIQDIFDSKKVQDSVSITSKKYSDKIDALMINTKSNNKYKKYVANILRSFLPTSYLDEKEITDLFDFSFEFLKEVDA